MLLGHDHALWDVTSKYFCSVDSLLSLVFCWVLVSVIFVEKIIFKLHFLHVNCSEIWGMSVVAVLYHG